MEHYGFWDTVRRFFLIAKQAEDRDVQQEREYRQKLSETERAIAKRDMYIREFQRYNQHRSF